MKCLIISQNKEVYEKFIVIFSDYRLVQNVEFEEVKKLLKCRKYDTVIVDLTKFDNWHHMTFIPTLRILGLDLPLIIVTENDHIRQQVEMTNLDITGILSYPIMDNELQVCLKKVKELIWYRNWKKERSRNKGT